MWVGFKEITVREPVRVRTEIWGVGEGGGRSVARLYMKESHLVDLGVGIQDGGLWGGEWRGEQSEQ